MSRVTVVSVVFVVFPFITNYFFRHLVLKTAKSWTVCLVVSNKSFSFATE